MEGEIEKLREENETSRRDLQRRNRESDGELALQKQVFLLVLTLFANNLSILNPMALGVDDVRPSVNINKAK